MRSILRQDIKRQQPTKILIRESEKGRLKYSFSTYFTEYHQICKIALLKMSLADSLGRKRTRQYSNFVKSFANLNRPDF